MALFFTLLEYFPGELSLPLSSLIIYQNVKGSRAQGDEDLRVEGTVQERYCPKRDCLRRFCPRKVLSKKELSKNVLSNKILSKKVLSKKVLSEKELSKKVLSKKVLSKKVLSKTFGYQNNSITASPDQTSRDPDLDISIWEKV